MMEDDDLDEMTAKNLLIESLFNEGLPTANKQKKVKGEDVQMQEIAGGGGIFIPKQRKRKNKLPKGIEKGGAGKPDPERWLPKWQRSKYKKYARKNAKYMKGGASQGDAQIDTDVTKMD
jgi:hypothetical protein